MRKTFCAGLAVALVAGGAALQGVTFGQPDGNRHPFVGTIILQTASGYFSCSGTQMTATVFMTAGHCTESEGVANLNTWVKFDSKISFPGRANYATLGDFLDDPANGWVKGTAVAHPLYNDFNEFPATYDVGVVLLKKRVTMATYGALPPEGFLETIQTAADNRFTVVGYGLQGLIKPFFESIYERYYGATRLVELKSTFDGGMTAKFTNNPGSTSGGTCFGDSGGPIFYGDTNMVVSVVSWGITPCIGVDYNFRTDTSIALSFLRQYIG
jgi:Trypsin